MTRRTFGTLFIAAFAAVAVGFTARPAAAKATVFDVTGHWTGTATESTGGTVTVTADLQAATQGRTFTGMLTITSAAGAIQYNARGKVSATNARVTMTLTATGQKTAKLTGKLDTSTPEITGTYKVNNKHHSHGTFDITRP